MEAILKERLREFFFEGKRWYDLRRFGKDYVFKIYHSTRITFIMADQVKGH